jgi:carbon monoxide dehydrogenase subunit G
MGSATPGLIRETAMKIEGQRSYSAEREAIWSILNDPITMRRILPGCETLEPIAPDTYHLTVDVRLGRAVERLSGTVSLSEVEPYRSLAFQIVGQSPGVSTEGRGQIELRDAGEGTTLLAYEATLMPSATLSISPRLLETTARAFARRALDALERETIIRTRVYTTTTTPMDTPAPQMPTDVAIRRLAFVRRVLGLGVIVMMAWLLSRSLERWNARRARRQIVEVVEQVLEQVDSTAAESPIARDIA